MFNNQNGQSIIEFIVAVAILVIVAATSITVVLGSFNATRLAEEQSQAAFYAEEGLEAAQSIRNQDWTNLSAGTYGLSTNNGYWEFSGSSETIGDYTRVITVEEVSRDDNGDIVDTGGTVDENTYKITSAVSWNFSPTRSNSAEMTSYLTNWQEVSGEGGTSNITSCSEYCQAQGYNSGICVANVNQCANNNGGTPLSKGNQYCTGGGGSDTCCCQN